MDKSMEAGVVMDEDELDLKRREYEMNHKIDAILAQNPDKMPSAVYYIIPNELAERFCYYGIKPLLNSFFKSFLGMGVESATGLVHAFTSICYITPLIGAALADSLWGKYYTVVYLSVVYVLGTGLLAIFSAPQFLSFAGVLIALILIGCGTGGIKPCVAAHGGDQFLESQKTGLNKFYNYFYMAINVGSLIAFFATPKIKDLNCFGKEKDCFVYAFALCSCCMAIALGIFILGRRVYRIMPAAKTFIPWKICQILSSSFGMAFKDGFKKPVLAYAQGHYSEAMIEEVKDVSTMFTVLLPAPFFWMAFDQTGTTWQNQFTMMNMYGIPEEWGGLYNSFFIIVLVPVFTKFIYPVIEGKFGTFRHLDRMIAGMVFVALAFISTGLIQFFIDQNKSVLIFDEKAGIDICDQTRAQECVHGAWQIIPYILLTIGEILFSISGLNFTYEEVGKRMKASSASLWLLMVSLGNVLDVILVPALAALGFQYFFYLCAGIVLAATMIYVFIRFKYVYREDREKLSTGTPVVVVGGNNEKK